MLSLSYSGGGLSYTQSFGYDALSRLTTSQETNGGTSWSQTNGYDRYGNGWIDLGGGSQIFGLCMLLVMSFTATAFAQSEVRSPEKKTVDLAVTNLQVEARNINMLLSKIAYQYGVPISLEVATDDDLLKSKQLKVQVKKGTLADVLNSIVKQKPSYTWDGSENTIRVFPKSEFRDPLLQTLLEIRISHFTVPKKTAKFTVRQALTNRPELINLLASYGVPPANELFSPYDLESFGGDFSLNLENQAVRSILDHVIKNSQTRYWFIRRSGESLLINF